MILNWLVFGVPWQIQVLALAILAGLLIFLAAMIFGWAAVIRVLRPLAVPLLGLLAVIGLYSRARQEGYGKRIDEEHKVEEWAENVAVEKRDEARKMPDDKLDKEVDRWSKP